MSGRRCRVQVLDRERVRRVNADLTRDGQPAGDVLVHTKARPEGELVDELSLELVRTVGRQRTVSGLAAILEHHHRVVIETADVRAGASVLVRLRQARVVAMQAAPEVAAPEVPAVGEPLLERELDAVVVALRLRQRDARRREGREAFAGVGDDVDLVAVGVQRAGVFDPAIDLLVDVAQRSSDITSLNWCSMPTVASCCRIGLRSGSIASDPNDG